MAAIRRAVTVPASGTLRPGPYRYSLRVPALVESADDLAAIVVSAPGSRLGCGSPMWPASMWRRATRGPCCVSTADPPSACASSWEGAVGNALVVTDAVTDVLAAFRADHPDVRLAGLESLKCAKSAAPPRRVRSLSSRPHRLE